MLHESAWRQMPQGRPSVVAARGRLARAAKKATFPKTFLGRSKLRETFPIFRLKLPPHPPHFHTNGIIPLHDFLLHQRVEGEIDCKL